MGQTQLSRAREWADDVSTSGHGQGSDAALLDMAGLHRLVELLIERRYRVFGPVTHTGCRALVVCL